MWIAEAPSRPCVRRTGILNSRCASSVRLHRSIPAPYGWSVLETVWLRQMELRKVRAHKVPLPQAALLLG